MSEGIERISRSRCASLGLRNEERVVRACILTGPVRKFVEIYIGRQEIERRCSGMPYIDRMGKGTTTVVLSRFIARSNQCSIREHWQPIFRLAGCCYMPDVRRVLPRHEEVVG